MPDFNKPWDPYNHYNTTDNFNPFNIKTITPEIMARNFPYEACFYCKLGAEDPLKICYGSEICRLRIKDKRNPTYVQTMGRQPGEDKSLCITMRSGQMAWNFYHNLPIIFRAGNETGTVLHHKNRNPFNNHWTNISITDKHEKHHGIMRSFDSVIKELNKESQSIVDNKHINKQIFKLKTIYSHLEDIPDTPRVFIIVEIFNNFMKGYINQEQAEDQLERVDASLGEYLKNYDMRTIKYNNKHILEYERRIKHNAIQNIQQLVI